MARDKLKTYRQKRDFRRTSEPAGERRSSRRSPVFVIQEHNATTHHFDFRLEIDGVLVSWSVPKGPSTDPREKRLAIRTEDHPLDYADFEGMIPEDEYGGGPVIVWDTGAFENGKTGDRPPSLAQQLDDHHLVVVLHGKKLSGGYALTFLREENGRDLWLLVKMDDADADARRNPVNTQRESVLSGRMIDEVEAEADDDSG